MRVSTEQQRAAIKAAFRHALKLAGGGDSFCQATRVSAAQLSRYASPDYPDFPPADVILDLDLDLGEPSVIAALARMAGCRLEPSAATGAPFDMLSRAASMVRGAADAFSAIHEAMADGHLDAAEKRAIERLATQLQAEAMRLLRCVGEGGDA